MKTELKIKENLKKGWGGSCHDNDYFNINFVGRKMKMVMIMKMIIMLVLVMIR